MIGEVVGNYRVIAKAGEEPTGELYLAEHTLMGRRVAIKVFPSSVGSEPFLDGAQRVATLSHPSLVEIFDFGNHRGQAYLVMEHLQGQSLADRMRRGVRITIPQAVNIARQVAGALAVVHEAGLVHGHLVPANIVLTPDPVIHEGERAKILDAGLAYRPTDFVLTEATAQYMAPERLTGESAADPLSDLYALGCIFFEMLGGRAAFGADAGKSEATVQSIIDRHIHEDPPSLRELEPAVSPQLEALVLRLLARSRGDRPQSAAEVSAVIDELDGDGSISVAGRPALGSVPVSVSFDTSPVRPVAAAQSEPSGRSSAAASSASSAFSASSASSATSWLSLPLRRVTVLVVILLCVAGIAAYLAMQL